MWSPEPVTDSKFDSSVWPIPPSTPKLSILKNVCLAADLLLLSLGRRYGIGINSFLVPYIPTITSCSAVLSSKFLDYLDDCDPPPPYAKFPWSILVLQRAVEIPRQENTLR
jgi:hypothetical protein